MVLSVAPDVPARFEDEHFWQPGGNGSRGVEVCNLAQLFVDTAQPQTTLQWLLKSALTWTAESVKYTR